MLTEKELARIFSWLPYREDWPGDQNQLRKNINQYYSDLITSLIKNESFDTYFSEDGGLGNYLEFMCYPGGQNEYEGNAILVCVSLCAPFAAYGQVSVLKRKDMFGWGPMFSPDNAYDITDPVLFEIESAIKLIFRSNNLHLPDKDFLSRQLPGEVAERLKFENPNEGTQYLHGFFQKTD